nr:hypothetical protein [Mycobacterium malmoense]
MRTRDDIDDELRGLAAVRRSVRERGDEPSMCHIDELLDEWAAHELRHEGDG